MFSASSSALLNLKRVAPALILALTAAVSAKAQAARVQKVDVEKLSSSTLTFLSQPDALTRANCAATLNALTAKVTAFTSRDVKRADLVRQAKPIIENFWQSRLLVREKMIQFAQAGQLEKPCVSAIRNAFRSFRFVEEYVGVHTLAKGAWVDPKPTKVFSGGFPAVVKRPGLANVEFKTGDVLVSYGMAYGSAAIAHVGEDSGTFSHMAMIHIDAKGDAVTIEAHPEFGVKVAPLEKYLNDGKGRSALFRYQDPEMARVAAQRIYEIAYKADSSGHPIPYDFNMNLGDHSKLFCTEVVSYAFDLASQELGRAAVIPAFPTKISMKNSYILDAFGISARITFAPSDIEVDPKFTMLAEWRDLARVRMMHHQQAALQMQFRWLDELQYNYRSDLRTILDSKVLFTARHMPMFEGFVDDMVPPDLTEKTLEAVVQVYLTSDFIHDALIADDKLSEARAGTLLTSSEILAKVEEGREKDLEAYLTYQRWMKYDRFSGDPAPSTDQYHWLLRSDDEVAP